MGSVRHGPSMPARGWAARFVRVCLPAGVLAGVLWGVLAGGVSGCASTGIAIRESLGQAKREQLVDRVGSAKAGQEAARQQFADALDEFMAVTRAEGGELERVYGRLRTQLDRCESRAGVVRDRIRAVDRVGTALFAEWERELDQYQSVALRESSEQQLRATRAEYDQMLGAMRRAESRMEPVLRALRDQVLFLKHNLNARAVASLRQEAVAVESEVLGLIAEMNASIEEAAAFIDSMRGG